MGVEGGWNSTVAVKLCCVSHLALSCHLNSKRVWQLDLTIYVQNGSYQKYYKCNPVNLCVLYCVACIFLMMLCS